MKNRADWDDFLDLMPGAQPILPREAREPQESLPFPENQNLSQDLGKNLPDILKPASPPLDLQLEVPQVSPQTIPETIPKIIPKIIPPIEPGKPVPAPLDPLGDSGDSGNSGSSVPGLESLDPFRGFGKLRTLRPKTGDPVPGDWPPQAYALKKPLPHTEIWGSNPVLSVEAVQPQDQRLRPMEWILELSSIAQRPGGAADWMAWQKLPDGRYRLTNPSHMLLIAPFLGKRDRTRLGLSNHRVFVDSRQISQAGGIPVLFKLRVSGGKLQMLHQEFELPNWYRNKFMFLAVFPDRDTAPRKVLGTAGFNFLSSLKAWGTPSIANATSIAAWADGPLAALIDKKGCPEVLHEFLRFSPSIYPFDGKYHLAAATGGKYALSPPHAVWKGLPPHPGWKTTSGAALLPYLDYLPRPLAVAVLKLSKSGNLADLDTGKAELELESSGGVTLFKGGAKSSVARTPKIALCPEEECGKACANALVKLKNPQSCAQCGRRPMLWSEVVTRQSLTDRETWRRMVAEVAPDALAKLHEIPEEKSLQGLSDDFLDSLLPAGETYFAHQRDAIRHCASWKVSLQGDVMGAGKTLVALKTLEIAAMRCGRRQPRLLAVVPANLVLKWRQDSLRWTPNRSVRVLGSQDSPIPGELSIISYDTARSSKAIQKISWDLVVLDESHSVKNTKAKRTKAILALESRQWMLITGTALYNRPVDLYPYFHLAAPRIFNSPDRFAKGFPLEKPKAPTGFEEAGLDLLGSLLRNSIMIRRPREELLRDMPKELPPEVIPVAIAPQRGRSIRAMEKEIAEIESRQGKGSAFPQIIALRKNIGELKLPAVRDFVDHAALAKEPFLIFTWRQSVARDLFERARMAGLKPGLLSGELNAKERFRVGEQFQAGDLDCVVGTMKASGVGLDLFRATTVVFAELEWSPSDVEQARGRAWRPGQTKSMRTIYYIVPESMMDSHMAGTLAGKNRSASRGMGDLDPSVQSILQALREGQKAS